MYGFLRNSAVTLSAAYRRLVLLERTEVPDASERRSAGTLARDGGWLDPHVPFARPAETCDPGENLLSIGFQPAVYRAV